MHATHVYVRASLTMSLLVVLILASLPSTPIQAASQIEPESAAGALATTAVELPAAEMTWQAAGHQSIAEDGASLALAPGFVYALDDPLLVTLEGDGRQEHIQAGQAIALPQAAQARPVAMTAAAPIPFVTIELLDAVDVEDPDAVTFETEQGRYDLTLWLLDLSNELPEDAVKQMSKPQLPFLVIVRQGEVDVPARVEGEPSRRLAMGEWVVLKPNEKLAMAPDTSPPVLLVAMLTQPESPTAQPGAPTIGNGPSQSQVSLPSRSQGGGTSSGQGGGNNTQPTMVPTAVPTTLPTVVTEPTTEPIVPTMEPTVPPPPPDDNSSSSGEAPGSSIDASGCTGSDLIVSCVDDTPLLLPTADPGGGG